MYFVTRLVYSLATLYMMAILLRWLAPWLEIDLEMNPWRRLRTVADPLVDHVRRMLPPMGPADFGPPAAVFLVWLIRTVILTLLVGMNPGL
jgi:uncharacterized protein YggT (Ycf19 family)